MRISWLSFRAWQSPAAILTSIAAGVILLALPFDGLCVSPLQAVPITALDASGRRLIEGTATTSSHLPRKDVGILADAIVNRSFYLQKALDGYGTVYDLSFLPDQSTRDAQFARRVSQVNILKILTMMKRYAQAEAAARAAWLNDPGNPGIAQYVGLFALMRGKPNEAIPVLIDGYNSLDDFPARGQFEGPILAYLGNAYEQKGDCAAANTLYWMAAKDPDIQILKCERTIQ